MTKIILIGSVLFELFNLALSGLAPFIFGIVLLSWVQYGILAVIGGILVLGLPSAYCYHKIPDQIRELKLSITKFVSEWAGEEQINDP